MEGLLRDLNHSIRMLGQNMGFTVAAVAALALGIGANTAIFSIVSAVLLRPLPYTDADRIVVFKTPSRQGSGVAAASPTRFNVWREQTSVFEDVAAYRYGRINMTGVDHPEQVESVFVSANYFRLFGQVVARGRVFTAAEDRPEGGDVVVFSNAFWKRAFGGDPRVIGRSISLSGKTYEVIGIMARGVETESPAAFNAREATEPIDVWMPLQIDPNSTDQNLYLNVAGRLKPGVAVRTAAAQLQLATEEFRRQFPAEDIPIQSTFTFQSMRDALVGGERLSLAVLSGAVSLVLLIACANVANLLLIRASRRQREIAIRAALGARRGRIIRQLLTESLLLSAIGGMAGLGLGLVCIRALLALNTVSYARIGDHGSTVIADWRVLCFTLVISFTTGIMFGLIPALQASRSDLGEGLKENLVRSDTFFRPNKARSAVVVVEVALALVLLIGAGLLIRTFIALRSVNPGFETQNVLTMQISLTAPRFQKTAGVAELARESVQRISALPGVSAAAVTCCLPLEGRTIGGVIIVGRPLSGRSHGVVNISTISPSYFKAFKIPILRGRILTEQDVAGAAPVVIISEAMALRFWPNDDRLGSSLKASLVFPDVPAESWQIVGIAGDVHADALSSNPPPIVYFPIAQAPEDLNAYLVRSPMAWIVRTRGNPYSLTSAVQKRAASGE